MREKMAASKVPVEAPEAVPTPWPASKVPPLAERTWKRACAACAVELHFGLAQIHRYPSWWTTFGYADSDGFFVKCPCCLGLVDVKASLPGWVQKRVV